MVSKSALHANNSFDKTAKELIKTINLYVNHLRQANSSQVPVS